MSRSFRAIGARARHPAARTLLIAGSATVGTGLLLAACSGATLNSARSTAPHRAIPAAGTPAFAAAGQGSAATGKTAGRAGLALSTQSIIYTADLTLRVNDVAAQAEAAKNIVTAVGGYVAREQEITPPGRHRTSVQLALKIPVAQYAQTLDKLKALHGKQIAFNQHAVDVTQRVADVNSRVASAQAAISQLRALLRRAGSVSQLLPVQEQINSQESELEALLAQQRALAHETSYATVTVLLLGHHAVIVKKHQKIPGFAGGLRGGWHALGLVVGWVLTALGSILPFAVLLALIGGLIYASRRRLGRRKPPPAADPPAAPAA